MLHQGLVYRQQSQSPLKPGLGRETCKRLPINWWAFLALLSSSSTDHPTKGLGLLKTHLTFVFYSLAKDVKKRRHCGQRQMPSWW